MSGYTGKILRINLNDQKVTSIDTGAYQQWIGGHGMGSAIFYDLVKDKAICGFHPDNIVTIMTSPLSGTLAPGASARTEVQGIGVQSSPIEWFTRSNFGGRFSAMLKYAGWDGIIIEGKAEKPVWIDIRNDSVHIRKARNLWGLDTWQTQDRIWREVCGKSDFKDWIRFDTGGKTTQTTQRPAVLTIGPAGENLSRTACLIHDAGNAAGQGGFGGVWGSKNLKAISVIGTGSIQIANAEALVEARIWAQKKYSLNLDSPEDSWFAVFGRRRPQNVFWKRRRKARLQACIGCHLGCKERTDLGLGNESTCQESAFYVEFNKRKHSGKMTNAVHIAADLLQRYGINAYEATRGLEYIRDLHKKGVLGPGKEIECDLPFEKLGDLEFVEKFLKMIAYREGIGDDFAEGFYRAAKRWGRLEEDLKTGLLYYSYWGLPDHGYDPRAEVEWGYGSILGDRDINEHDFNIYLFWGPSIQKWNGLTPKPSAKRLVQIISSKLVPYENNTSMLNFSEDNIYSHPMAKLVAWHRYYTRFWKQSVLYCDHRWPDFMNTRGEDDQGLTGDGEPIFLNAVTGNNFNFSDGMEIGRKIWNLDNAIWTLQGRHRDMVHFSDYIYEIPFGGGVFKSVGWYYLPGKLNGKWDYISVNGRRLDRSKFESFKTKFYELQGWDPKTGWPNRKTLESMGLAHVAEQLSIKNKLGET